ncbi:hypothetical protein HDV05_004178 [Chytridiales sp. JEL 0842]|nr:hypothetical protein HDV05_004178 [Chytridiales sp. JEL 0842]
MTGNDVDEDTGCKGCAFEEAAAEADGNIYGGVHTHENTEAVFSADTGSGPRHDQQYPPPPATNTASMSSSASSATPTPVFVPMSMNHLLTSPPPPPAPTLATLLSNSPPPPQPPPPNQHHQPKLFINTYVHQPFLKPDTIHSPTSSSTHSHFLDIVTNENERANSPLQPLSAASTEASGVDWDSIMVNIMVDFQTPALPHLQHFPPTTTASQKQTHPQSLSPVLAEMGSPLLPSTSLLPSPLQPTSTLSFPTYFTPDPVATPPKKHKRSRTSAPKKFSFKEEPCMYIIRRTSFAHKSPKTGKPKSFYIYNTLNGLKYHHRRQKCTGTTDPLNESKGEIKPAHFISSSIPRFESQQPTEPTPTTIESATDSPAPSEDSEEPTSTDPRLLDPTLVSDKVTLIRQTFFTQEPRKRIYLCKACPPNSLAGGKGYKNLNGLKYHAGTVHKNLDFKREVRRD